MVGREGDEHRFGQDRRRDGGTVTENGTPNDLLASDGAYAKLRCLRYQVPACVHGYG